MKIVVIGTRGIPHIMGGVETHCEELYPRLANLGCEVIVIRRSCYITDENKIKKYKGVRLKDVYAPKKKSLEAILHSFISVIQAKRMKADILHVHAIGPALIVPFARLLGLKVVLTHHGPDYDRQKWGKMARFFLKMGERLGVKYANEVIVISSVIDDIIRKKYKRTDARLIYNGVPTVKKIHSTNYIEKLNLLGEKYILAMGRFVPEKGFDLLIDAYLKIKNPELKLVIAGDADHETAYSLQLKKKAKRYEIILTGFITGEKLQELLTHAQLFVLPSFHEGLPIALLEAMSYNLDVLVSDISANREVSLSSDSFFQMGNIKDLTQKLNAKIANNNSFVTYNLKLYNWDKIATQTLNVYEKIN